MENLPKGWMPAKFEDVCEIVSGKNQKDVVSEKGKFPIYGSGGIMGLAKDYLCDEGTTIIGRKGTINSPIYVEQKFWNVDTAFGLSPKQIFNRRLFFYFCKGFNFKKLDKSTTIPSLAKSDLLQIEIPLPPLAEQHRIVAKIEELFSSLDKGIESLQTARQQLKVYRQAVLKWAFEGRLTNPNLKEGELPEGWEVKRIKDIGTVINGDRSSNYPSRAHYVDKGVPFISAGNIENNTLFKSDLNFITKEKFNSLRSGKTQIGDILYCLRGSLGKTAIIDMDEAGISSSLCILRLFEGCLTKYFHYYLLSPLAKNEILKHDNGTAQPNLSSKSFEEFLVTTCSIDNQERIVQEIESRLSICDKIEESIAQSLQQAEALRQSILKKAFEGKLVPQDPNDEPASVLLERIQALRQPQADKKTRKATKKNTL